MLKEFRRFILRGNVVDLAVGVVIGAAFGGIVTAVVSGLFNPLIAIFGDTGLRELSFSVGTRVVTDGGVARRIPNEFQYGAVLDAVVNFVLVAAAVFFFVVKPVNHLMERFKVAEPKEETTRPCPECLSSIPKAARRCAYCTAEVGTAP